MKYNKEEQAAIDRVSPLCINCEHCMDRDWEPVCRKAALKAEPVGGIISYNSCEKERELKYSGAVRETCGPTGRNYEPFKKKGWLDRLIGFLCESFDDEEEL